MLRIQTSSREIVPERPFAERGRYRVISVRRSDRAMLCIAGFRPNGTSLVRRIIFVSQYVLLLPAMLERLSWRLRGGWF
jgi:hypothetical protein